MQKIEFERSFVGRSLSIEEGEAEFARIVSIMEKTLGWKIVRQIEADILLWIFQKDNAEVSLVYDDMWWIFLRTEYDTFDLQSLFDEINVILKKQKSLAQEIEFERPLDETRSQTTMETIKEDEDRFVRIVKILVKSLGWEFVRQIDTNAFAWYFQKHGAEIILTYDNVNGMYLKTQDKTFALRELFDEINVILKKQESATRKIEFRMPGGMIRPNEGKEVFNRIVNIIVEVLEWKLAIWLEADILIRYFKKGDSEINLIYNDRKGLFLRTHNETFDLQSLFDEININLKTGGKE